MLYVLPNLVAAGTFVIKNSYLLQLKDHADLYGHGPGTTVGYALELNEETRANLDKHTSNVEIAVTVILSLGTSCIIVSTSFHTSQIFLELLKKNFHFFWSFQIIALVFMTVNYYIAAESVFLGVILFTAFIGLLPTALLYMHFIGTKLSLKTPVTQFLFCNVIRSLYFILPVINTFSFIYCIVFALPWLILDFYLYTITTYVRVIFIVGALVCLILIGAVILYYFELLMCHFCYMYCSNENSCKALWRSNSLPNIDAESLKETVLPVVSRGNERRLRFLTMIAVVFKLITCFFLLGVVVFTLYILFNIVFMSQDPSLFQGLLSTIPTVAIAVTAYFFQSSLHPPTVASITSPHHESNHHSTSQHHENKHHSQADRANSSINLQAEEEAHFVLETTSYGSCKTSIIGN